MTPSIEVLAGADAGTVKAEEHHRVHSKMEWYRKMYDSQKIEISNFKQEISRLKEKVTLGRSPSSSKDKHSARVSQVQKQRDERSQDCRVCLKH